MLDTSLYTQVTTEIWAEVERRMGQRRVSADAPVEAYKHRLMCTAKAFPTGLVRAAVGKMKSRAADVVRVGGGEISVDWRHWR